VWNRWRLDNAEIVPDLRGADLRRSRLTLVGSRSYGHLPIGDLSEGDTHGQFFDCYTPMNRNSIMKGMMMEGINFSGADLSGADLRRAVLGAANFRDANLDGCKLTRSYLRAARFDRTSLKRANFSQATISRTIFADVDLSETEGLEHVNHFGPSVVGIGTIYRSQGRISQRFLRGTGVPELLLTYMSSLVDAGIDFYSCFISYSHADRGFARRLHDSLQSRGVRCWLDEKQMLAGDDIYEGVDRGIRLWDKVVLCCSANSLKPTSWVDKEIAAALLKEDELSARRGEKVCVLIPLNLDGYVLKDEWHSGHRSEIRRRLVADFTGWRKKEGFDREIEKLIRALRSDVAAREQPPNPKG
jgi:uncharacterized protein YjbI with pentapeptide repeats